MRARNLALAAVLAMGAVQADASTFSFSYELDSGSVLDGLFEGTLQGDADTIIVLSFSDVTFDGGPRSITFVDSFSNFNFGSGADPVLSLSGTIADIIACTTPVCLDGFVFDAAGVGFGAPIVYSGPTFGEALEPYDPTRFSVEQVMAAIPLPASAFLLIGALGSLRLARRRAA